MADPRSAVGRHTADPRVQGLSAEAGPSARPLALRDHAATPGRHVRRRDVVAAPERDAAPGGEALLLDDGAGRGAPHRGVAEARRGGRRRGRARSAPRQARRDVPRARHARGEGVPDAGLLRAADHPALPDDRRRLAGHRARGPLQKADDRRRHPPQVRRRLRARAPRRLAAGEAQAARQDREPDAADLRRPLNVAAEGTRVDRGPDAARAMPRDQVPGQCLGTRSLDSASGPGPRTLPRDQVPGQCLGTRSLDMARLRVTNPSRPDGAARRESRRRRREGPSSSRFPSRGPPARRGPRSPSPAAPRSSA